MLTLIAFLAFVDNQANVTRVEWCTPEGFLTANQSLIQVFGEESGNELLQCIRGIRVDDTGSDLVVQTEHQGEIVSITLHCCSINTSTIIFGTASSEDANINQFIRVYNEYVNSMRREFKKLYQEREAEVTKHLEELQNLNNELTNTQRKLHKANAKLNVTNKELQHSLSTDALTGLIGRYQFWREIEKLIISDPGKLGIFTFIDLDHFKSINDRFGHSKGDEFLIVFAKRLRRILTEDTLKIRVAGDEFALFSYGYTAVTANDLQNIWRQLCNRVLNDPIVIDGLALPVSASAGMAIYGDDTDRIAELIEYADFAMYQAKRKGKNQYCRFNKADYGQRNQGCQREATE